MKVFSVLFSLTFLLCGGCNLLSNEGQGEQQARIIFGKSIDGVEIGDSADQVIDKLGEPSYIGIGDFIGEIYTYQARNSIMMEVSISEDTSLGLGVIHFIVYAPYTGKTENSVGIGTDRSEALKALGQPDYIDNKLYDVYLFEHNQFFVSYRQKEIYFIVMAVKIRF